VLTLGLVVYGLVFIYSATCNDGKLTGGDPYHFVKRQVLWLGVGLLVLFFFSWVDYHQLAHYTRLIYWGNLLLLMLVLVVGKVSGGSQRWLGWGPFRLQPSEFAKIAVIVTLALFLAQEGERIGSLRTVLKAFLHLLVPMALIVKQPDLGTALTFLFFWFGMLWVAEARGVHLLLMFLGGLASFALMWHFDVLKDYQKERLLMLYNPEADPRGRGYQLIQSKVAIGSGQVWGKGLTQGTQSQLHFIPARHTDFIFSVVGEEWGLAGGAALLFLYALLLWRGLSIVLLAQDDFGRFIATGLVCMMAFHVFVNIGMTVGLMPVTGLPLPFFSYGGSNLLTNLTAVGLLLSIAMRRQKIKF